MRVSCAFLVAALFLSAPCVQAESASPVEPVPLVFWNRQIHVFRSYVNQQSPAERAAKARERLASLPTDAYEWRVAAAEATVGQYTGVIVSVNDQPLFAIL